MGEGGEGSEVERRWGSGAVRRRSAACGGSASSTGTMRTHELERSATRRAAPAPGSRHMHRPQGELKWRGERPGAPLPARVTASPSGVTRRIVWLPESATYTLPSASTLSPLGAEKAAASPRPSAWRALPQPAMSVVTPLFGSMHVRLFEWKEDT